MPLYVTDFCTMQLMRFGGGGYVFMHILYDGMSVRWVCISYFWLKWWDAVQKRLTWALFVFVFTNPRVMSANKFGFWLVSLRQYSSSKFPSFYPPPQRILGFILFPFFHFVIPSANLTKGVHNTRSHESGQQRSKEDHIKATPLCSWNY